ncbi:MAG TPA: hypothetical protein VF623_12830, partial [Segetibacter sp.]
ISGSVFASMSFNMLGDKDKGIYWLSLPATHFEKLVATIFYTTVLFSIIYCLCFYLIKTVALIILKQLMADTPGFSYQEMQDFSKGFGEVFPYFICGFFAVQALYLLGSVYFSRYSFIVTSVVFALLFFSFMYYMTKLEHGFFEKGVSWDITQAVKRNVGVPGSYWLYSVSPTTAKIFKYLVMFGWAPVFWFVTWCRLREKEV